METEKVIKELKCFKKGDEVMSPEGTDEKVLDVQCFVITLTANGKYRLYFAGDTGKFTPAAELYDSIEKAKKAVAVFQMLMSGMDLHPEKTVDIILRMMGSKKKD